MTNFRRAAFLLGVTSSLSFFACATDEQSLGANDLASTSGGSAGSANAGRGGVGGAGANASGGNAGGPSGGFAGGGGTTTQTPRRICDGADGIALGHSSRGGGQIESLDTVYFEAGFGSFYVDGHCNYWIINADEGDSRHGPARTGTLTEAEETQLAIDFDYASWGALSGDYCGFPAPDQGGTYIFDRATALVCSGAFEATTPAAVKTAFTNANAWRQKLLAQGTPLTGPIRLRSLRSDALGWKTHPLSLSFSLASVAITSSDYLFGDAPLITLPEDLTALRALRALILADTSSIASQFEVVGSDGLRYQVAFRDALPIEDEHGLVPIPGVPNGN